RERGGPEPAEDACGRLPRALTLPRWELATALHARLRYPGPEVERLRSLPRSPVARQRVPRHGGALSELRDRSRHLALSWSSSEVLREKIGDPFGDVRARGRRPEAVPLARQHQKLEFLVGR